MEVRRLWDPVPEFDSIFSADNVLNDDIIDRHDKTEIERIMHLMLEDALTHFAHEERLFIKMNYPAQRSINNTMLSRSRRYSES